MDPRQDGEVAGTGSYTDDTPLATLRDVRDALGPLARGEDSGRLVGIDDAALIDVLGELRMIRGVLGAVEARVQVTFDASQRAAAEQRGVPRRDRGKGVADQIALARGVSAHRAANDLALVKGLVTELPVTMDRLASGAISEGAATAVAKETVCLQPEDRAVVDERVAPRLTTRTSARRAATVTRAEAARVDGESVTARIRMAEKERCVTVRPAPDAMVYLSALMPVKEGIAAYASLDRHATAARAAGDGRSRGQIMADELLARLTGVSDAALIPVEIQLVMPAETLLRRNRDAQDDCEASDGTVGEVPGRIGDHIIPAELCREIALIPNDAAQRWIRRVFTDPVSGSVREVDERRRLFTGALRAAIITRDQACRMCGAPIRDVDHVNGHHRGGVTTWLNGQALCQRCNLTKALPGWTANAFQINGSHVTVTRTPTGHKYTSHAPPALLVSPDPPAEKPPSIEHRLARIIDITWRTGPDKAG